MNNIKSDSKISNNFLYHKTGLLKIEHIYVLEIAKFMHMYHNNKLLYLFKLIITLNLLNRCTTYYETRANNKKIIFYQVFRLVFQKHRIQFMGAKIWNNIPDEWKNNSYKKFIKTYKNHFN